MDQKPVEMGSDVPLPRARELCACGETASQRCLRCDAPFCRAHAPSFAHRCAECEDAYAELRRDRQLNPLTGLQVLLTYATGIFGVLFAWIVVEGYSLSRALLVLAAILACFLPPIAIHWRRIRLRGEFLRERPGRRPLRTAPRPERAAGGTTMQTSEPAPAHSTGDSLAIASFILALLFFLPGIPVFGLACSIAAYLARERCRTSAKRAQLALAALIVSLAAIALQVYVFVAILPKLGPP